MKNNIYPFKMLNKMFNVLIVGNCINVLDQYHIITLQSKSKNTSLSKDTFSNHEFYISSNIKAILFSQHIWVSYKNGLLFHILPTSSHWIKYIYELSNSSLDIGLCYVGYSTFFMSNRLSQNVSSCFSYYYIWLFYNFYILFMILGVFTHVSR